MNEPPQARSSCPRCGRLYAAGVEVCPHDGADLVPVTPGPDGVGDLSPAFINAPTVNEIPVNGHDNASTLIDPEAAGELEQVDPRQMLGREVDGFTLLEVINEGRTGWLFEARDEGSGEAVAFKYIHPPLARLKAGVLAYFHEARAASSLGHRHTVEVFKAAPINPERTYLVMELLRGQDLLRLLRQEGRLTSRRAVAMALQVTDALRAARGDAGMMSHLDLRPEHIYLAARESRDELVKVLDFGVHRLQAEARQEGLDRFMPPAAHRAPELNTGQAGLGDARSDIYSLGVILHQAVTGQLPFMGSPVRPDAAPSPAGQLDRLGSVDPALRRVVTTCLATRPEERYASLDALEAGLRAVFSPLASAPTVAPAGTSSTPGLVGAPVDPALANAPTMAPGAALANAPTMAPGAALSSAPTAPPALATEPTVRELDPPPPGGRRLLVILITAGFTLGLAVVGVLLLDHFLRGEGGAREPVAVDRGPAETLAPDAGLTALDVGTRGLTPSPDLAPLDAGSPDLPPPDLVTPDAPRPDARAQRRRPRRGSRPRRRPARRPAPRPTRSPAGEKEPAPAPAPAKDPGQKRPAGDPGQKRPGKITPDLVKDPFGD